MCKVQILLPWCDIQRLLILVGITEILFKLVFEDYEGENNVNSIAAEAVLPRLGLSRLNAEVDF